MSSQREIIDECGVGEVLWDAPMADYSSLRVGGPADAVVLPENSVSLARLLSKLTANGVPWQVIGRGSNILVSDRGIRGVVVILGERFSRIIEKETKETVSDDGQKIRKIFVESGCSLPKLTNWCAKKGISGLEFASGIPGSVGGAVVMNAGAWGGEICERLKSVQMISPQGSQFEVKVEKADFSYRSWNKRPQGVVVAAVFNLHTGVPEAIKTKCHEYDRVRKTKQPQKVASAGSFFKNPPTISAGALIEKAGLKGVKCGGAMVSEVHANFLVNMGNATANDFYQLAAHVQSKVFDNSSIRLQPEVQFVGEWEQEINYS